MAFDTNRLAKPAQKLRKLVAKMDKNPPPEEVHDLRTRARQFETIFTVLPLGRQGVKKSTLKDLIRCRKRAGKVRDMDVLTANASRIHLDGEAECLTQLLAHLGSVRRKQVKKLYAEVRHVRPGLSRDLKRTSEAVTRSLRDKKRSSVSTAGPAAAAVTLAVELAVPEHLTRGNLHPYRLKIKTLRDVLRMAGGSTHPRFVDDLTRVKDAIGDWHDWEELLSIARDVLDHGNRCGLLAELKRKAGGKYEHALRLTEELRGRYLTNSTAPKKGERISPKLPGQPVWEAIALLAG